MVLNTELIQRVKNYAIICHNKTNHFYDVHEYKIHLAKVADFAESYAHLLDEKDASICIAAAWAHDVIEDTRETYNDVAANCGVEIADIVYALTNEKGKNRNERANERYYAGIRKSNRNIYVKLCDRLANVLYSLANNSNMYHKYQQEHNDFLDKLLLPKYMRLRWIKFPQWYIRMYMRITKRDKLLPMIIQLA
jgi:(p)ppGpp synthase/HD superfamily hydrolase